ncbi:MAG: shikimate dehydrogenase [Deltaproteobacteria bacterium]|nr:shikimate dehydrogenase [Deltaproteobacteria bacterium]
MKITGNTKIVGIFGDPVGQTLSPAMHNAAFEALGLDMAYVPFHVRPMDLGEAVRAVRALNMRGVNVTIPHKEEVLKHLDGVDDHARDIGAVNSIVNRDSILVGYNTDGPGYLLSLRDDAGCAPAGKNVVIIGAGGAARSISYAVLGAKPASVTIANRTRDRAVELAAEFRKKFRGVDIHAAPLEKEALRPLMRSTDIVVNTTSLGMMGKGVLDLPIEELPPHAVVSDIVYRPIETDIIRKAAARGIKTHGGLGMLVRQGAITFELWTGRKAPLDAMRKAAMEEFELEQETIARPGKAREQAGKAAVEEPERDPQKLKR